MAGSADAVELGRLCEAVKALLPKITPAADRRPHYPSAVAVVNAKLQQGVRGPDRDAILAGYSRFLADAQLKDLAPDMADAIVALVADRDAWRQAMQRLTAGGSEFTTPKACEEWAAMLRTELHTARCDKVRATKRLHEIAEACELQGKMTEASADGGKSLAASFVRGKFLDRILAIARGVTQGEEG